MPNVIDLEAADTARLIELRHDLHRNPELGYQESRTSGVIQRELTAMGVKFVAGLGGGTGVLAHIPSTHAGAPTIALRADMDALPIHEATGLAYASTSPGVMHACGHDGHTSILLGVARTLSRSPDRPNNVLMIFQPAEEGGAGGKKMCEDGVLQGKVLGSKADMIYGLHGSPTRRLGEVSTRIGPLMAAATQFEITIKGKGCHAAYPHMGIDPIVVGSQMVMALQTVASRTVGPLDSVVVTIGIFRAGVAHNVIPDTASLHGTLRTLIDETQEKAKRRIGDIAKGISTAFGATAEIEWAQNPYPVVVNHAAPTERFREIAKRAVTESFVREEPEPSMGGEDFAFYGREVPACFYWLGLCPDSRGDYPLLHSPEFDFNDDALPTGVRLMCELALSPA